MNNDVLKRKLQSVGMQAFVQNYQLFKAFAQGSISRDRCIQKLIADGVSADASGAGIRTGNAAPIFQARRERDELLMIGQATKVPASVKLTAKTLTQQE